MEELPPLLDYIRKAEEAEKDAAQPPELALAAVSDLPPPDEPARPVPAPDDGQRVDQLVADEAHADGGEATRAAEGFDPVEREGKGSSLYSGFKTVDFQNKDTTTVSTTSVLRTVQALHEPGKDETGKDKKRPPICYCGAPRLKDVDVHLRDDGTGRTKAGVSGIWRCRNGETCPLCIEAATARRTDAYARVGKAAIKKGGSVVSVVLSVSHSLEDKLADLMAAVKKASTGARAGGPWHRNIKVALGALGVLVDHHVRYGQRFGWHYHQHLTIFCLNRDAEAIKVAVDALVERYLRLLARQGYRAAAERQHVKVLTEHPEGKAYTYPANHNPGDDDEAVEVAAVDHGEDESLSPMQLAERAAHGDNRAAALFMEFSAAIKKTRGVIVTPAMAMALEIERKEEEPAYTEQTRLGSIPGKVWTKLIDQNLNGTFLTRVELAGRENWLAVRWWALEQTGEAPEYSNELADELAELFQAQQRLVDPTAKQLAQDQIGIMQCDWNESHGADLVVATMDYVKAHFRHMRVDKAGVEYWMATLDDLAGKVHRRRAAASHTTLPMGDSPPSVETVSHGSVRDRVRQNYRNSQHA
ncbi:hypothetical protein [Devosia sp. MC521]|uniref:hypothetical protein n=1 Tax=Devosia sp. MC521 TaxID=2759954 RepID=UPI0015F81C5E|nr:hypothetical protein [Devosia sp. MC521]MBJ6987276.1 hypothetical protein [Devosia sp. MC521]QMW62884.1 hypothetical protein H4N61_00485 [Devosia sp. MC521]